MALEEAYYRQEKTITAETLYDAEWFNESEWNGGVLTGEGKSLFTYAYKYIVYYVLNEKLIGLSLLINLIFYQINQYNQR